MPILLLLVFLTGEAGGAAAEQGRVSAVLNPHGVDVQDVTVVLEKAESGQAAIQKTLRRDTPLVMELPEGNWSLDVADSPQLWHQRQHFYVPGSGTGTVIVDVWPRSTFGGRVATKAAPVPAEVRLRFEPVAVPPMNAGPSGEVRCPVEQAVFRCSLPAGEFDVRLRPPGFIAHYVSGLSLPAGDRIDLGTIPFRQGQSIAGRVQMSASFKGDITAVVVTAEPVGAPEGSRMLAITAKPAKNGFFHLDGVAPGLHAVRATYQQLLHSDRVQVEVRSGREAELIDPIRLGRPRRIRLSMSPPLGPGIRPWHVALRRYSGDRDLDMVSESNATPEGAWESPRLQPDHYQITIGTIGGDVWHEEQFELRDEDVDVHITVPAAGEIRGLLTLGGKPLQASVTFTGSSGTRVTAQSDEDGRFVVLAPRPTGSTLVVDVQSDVPTVSRRVKVNVPENGEELRIALPGAVLSGEVVDSEGAPAEDSIVSISSGDAFDGLVQPETDPNGKFEAHGLAPGRYSIVAAGFLSESEPVNVELKEDQSHEPVRLVLQESHKLRGRVVSSQGGVPGARVQARAVDVEQMMAGMPPTDVNGDFVIAVPRNARLFDLTVAAPGFSYLIRRVKPAGRPLNLDVEQQGGTLVVLTDARQVPWLVHDGATVPMPAVMYAWPVRTEERPDGSQQFVLPMMEPGSYAACIAEPAQLGMFRTSAGQTGGRCIAGSLAAFGTVTLDLRSRQLR